ncbi:MAG: hypothetical protein QG670_1479 [Thermoproteota archaeon]|nr:hypothetical protein [Thermoproteota archaeon]
MSEVFKIWLHQASSYFLSIPHSSLFIFSIALVVVLVVMLIYRFATDVKRLQESEFEIRKYTLELNEANRKNDKVALRRLKREEIRLKHFRTYASKQRLKATLITILPLMSIYFLLSITFFGQQVAIFPFEIPLIGGYVPFYIWYLLCYMTMYLPLSRAFGVSPNMNFSGTRGPRTLSRDSRKRN